MTPLFFRLTVFSFIMTKKPKWIISSLRNLCTKRCLRGCVLREMWLKSRSSQNAERKKLNRPQAFRSWAPPTQSIVKGCGLAEWPDCPVSHCQRIPTRGFTENESAMAERKHAASFHGQGCCCPEHRPAPVSLLSPASLVGFPCRSFC